MADGIRVSLKRRVMRAMFSKGSHRIRLSGSAKPSKLAMMRRLTLPWDFS